MMKLKHIVALLIALLLINANAFSQAPSNDNCSGAINIPVNTNNSCYNLFTGTSVNATESMPGCDGFADDDVWYKFTIISSAPHVITITPTALNGINDVNFELFYGDCLALNSLVCVNNTTGNNPEVFAIGGAINQTYYFRVFSNGASAADRGSFEICIRQDATILNTNVLRNAGFEYPTQPTLGNHLLTEVPEWITDYQPNLISVDGTNYNGGPDTAHSGNQYIEMFGGDGYLMQYFTLSQPSTIHFGGWFSRREALTGTGFTGYIDIVDANSNLVVATTDITNFDCCNELKLWKPVIGTASISQGSYYFKVQLNDYANFDSAFIIPFDPNPLSVSIAASQTTICANINVSFTATPINIGSNPHYKWQKNGIDIIDTDNPVYNDNTLVNNDVITCKLSSDDGNGNISTVTSNAISISINPNCYCIPPYSINQAQYNITTVNINGISNSTTNIPPDGYNFFTSPVFTGEQATLSNFSITINNSFAYVRIWIDYNNNFSFEDPGELVFAEKRNGLLVINGSFFIPPNALTGNHQLRVRCNSYSAYSSCEQGFGGETEDYTINILPGDNCSGQPAASLIVASQYVICSGGSTDLTAYANGIGISYQWQKSTNSNTGFTNIAGANQSTYAASGINTNSYFRCMLTCAGSGISNASGVLSITIGIQPPNDSLCNAITLIQGEFDTQNTTCATVNDEIFAGADDCSLPNNTVWYKITPAVTERLKLKLNKIANDPYPIDAWVNIFKATGSCPNLVLTPVSPNPFNCLRANLPSDSSVIVEAGTYLDLPPDPTGILEKDSTYYIRIDGFIGSYGAYSITSLTPTVALHTWTGMVSDQWEDINNWSTHILPTANADVIIPGNLINYPKINSAVTVRSVKLNPGTSLNVLAGKSLKILH